MAHSNINERRLKVVEMCSLGYSKKEIMDSCSKEFNCHTSAIFFDIKRMNLKCENKKDPLRLPNYCGVYAIIFKDKWVYIGASKATNKRIRQHFYALKAQRHKCKLMNIDFAKEKQSFSVLKVSECSVENLLNQERIEIEKMLRLGYSIYNTYKLP